MQQLTLTEARAPPYLFFFPPAINRIADDGATDVGHVDPDLMGPAAAELTPDQRDAEREVLDYPIAGQGRLAARSNNRHALAVLRIAADWRIDDARGRLRSSPDNGPV